MKLFSKIATAFVGIAMAVGVGVAVSGNNSKEVRADDKTDTLTSSDLTATGTSYTDFSGVSKTSDAVYAGNSAKDASGNIQMRSKNSNSGIVSTTSGGKVKSVKITVASGSNTIDVYGSNSAYSAATDLYGSSAGTVVGSVTSTGTVTFSSDYTYVGIRSNNGAIYVSSVEITWTSGGEPTPEYTVTYDANGGTGTMEDTTNTVAACTFTAPEGKTFSTWNTAANGSGTDYAPGATASSDLDLFAIWVDKPAVVTLDKIGTTLESTANTTMETVDIADGSDTYTLNYLQCKKQGDSMLMTKDVNPFISNHTEMPGAITSIEVFINSGASGKTTYDVAFGTSEYTTATAGIGAVNITGGNSHVFENEDVDGATYFCITLGNANNGQVLKLVVNYEVPATNAKIVDTNGTDITSTFNIVEGYAPIVKYAEEDGTIIEGATWVAADSTVIQIMDHSSYVYLRGLKPGNTTVTASKSGYKTASISVQVTEDPTKPEMEIWDNTWKLDDGSGYWWTDEADLYWFYAHPAGDTERDPYERTILDDVSWDSSDKTVATITTQPGGQGSVTCLKPGETTLTATKSGYKSVSVTVSFNAGSVTDLLVSGSMTKTAYTTGDSWDPSGLVVKAYHDNTGWEDVVTSEATWTWSPAAPVEGVTSVVATAHWNDGEDDFAGSSDPQAVTFTVKHAGTADDPFTVAEGIAKCEEIGNVSGGEGPWVTTGKISSIVQVLTTGYQNARFYITEDGKTTSDSLYAYDCKYLGNEGFTEETAANMVVGATVTITGKLLNYNNDTPEYARGCYLLDIQEPETGDVDVTFNPASSSYEIGATGTFTASSETSGAVFTWSVDDSTVLSVNASTGAFEALELGVARVTVTATAGGKQGTAFADIVVNGSAGSYYSVSNANSIASGVASGKTTAYYIYVEGYVKEFATSKKDGNPRAFDIMTLDESSSIMVYTNVDPYAEFIDGLSLGDRIVVKGKIQNYGGTYEIVEPEKVGSNTSAITFSLDFLSETDGVCEGYDGKTNNKAALEAIWGGLSTSYSTLFDNQKSILMGAEGNEDGTTIEKAVARYDYLVTKYGLDNFISGRTSSVGAVTQPISVNDNNINSSMSIVVVAVIAITSLSAIGVLLVIKRRKSI